MFIIYDGELEKELGCYISKSISFYITQHEDCFAPVKFTEAAATHKERLVMAISSSLSQKWEQSSLWPALEYKITHI